MNKSFQEFICLSGLPRTGSTLLSAILSQNPLIHAEGNSPVCQLLWEMCNSLTNCKVRFQANNKEHLVMEYLKEIPHFYYKTNKEPIVIDKCRSWTIEPNYRLGQYCINPNLKIIIMVRPIIEIIKSFAKLYYQNGMTNMEVESKLNEMLIPDSDPILRSMRGIKWALAQNDNSRFLFIKYNDLVLNPKQTIQNIYNFCGWKYFEHDFENIIMKYPENDRVYGLEGFHRVRNKISKEENDIILSPEIVKKCNIISEEMNFIL